MTDWTALGQQPAPGSPTEIRAIALSWSRQAAAQRLASIQLSDEHDRTQSAWRDSAGADAFAAAVLAPARPIDATADVLADSAASLIRYAGELEEFQARAAALLGAAEGAHHRLDTDLSQLRQFAQPLAGLIALNPAGELRRRIAAGQDVQGAFAAIARARQDAEQLSSDAHSAALQTSAALARGVDALAGWQSGRAFGPYGGPAEGSMSTSSAYLEYVDASARSRPPVIPSLPAAAASYWRSLDPALQQAYLRLYPAVIGNAAGLPSAVRDQANRSSLAALVTGARNRAALAGHALPDSGADPERPANQSTITESLRAAGYDSAESLAVAGALTVDHELRLAASMTPGHPTVQLLQFDPGAFGGKGRAAIAIGDVSAADNVAVLVPGMTADVPHYLPKQMVDAANLYRSAGADSSTAVVAYIGYHAPGIDGNVLYPFLAAQGGALIAADLAGFAATRTGPEARTTVVAHSYGSTTAGYAFSRYGARADAVVLIGSPGAGPATTAADMHLPAGSVFVGSASSDPVTTLAQQAQDPRQVNELLPQVAGHFAGSEAAGATALLLAASGISMATPLTGGNLGVDPAGKHFGATRFHAESSNKDIYHVENHSLYFAPGSESLANITAIVKGETGRVTLAAPRPETGGHYEGFDPETAHRPER